MKSVRIRSYSGPYFPTFGLNTERYSVSLLIHSECGKIRNRINLNTDTFHAVLCFTKVCEMGGIFDKNSFILETKLNVLKNFLLRVEREV